MSKSYRVRTKVGVDTSLKVLIEQEFEHLEILSLKILQSDIYTRQCSDYGVIVGRVSVNNGFGLPNAKVSIFIPIDSIDQKDPVISELYPYKTLLDNNDEGYRYNLLPYVKSYSAHVPTGTFFTRKDVLTDPILIEVYDKYYKYNAITNDSGDYMIFGVPVGSHTIVMDVDLSDIGEFSLSPQDLIRMGIATETQVAGTNFRSSNNLRELPQIINLSKSIEVEPLWGQPEVCNLGITRTDFDLSSEANIDIRPTSVFMGSIISGPNSSAISTSCRPTSNSGHLCNLTVGPGDILAIRQTILQDSNGRPILENFSLENGGKVIDENGTWLIDVPMNLDYYVTNEFGEQVLSNDPEVGIPTKGKYRFKIKWAQSPSLGDSVKRGYFLVPNIKEYNGNNVQQSYAFSVDWNDYAYTGSTSDNVIAQKIVQDAINCEDKFYLMQYNKVYTVSQFISGRRNGSGTERYIGIKNILDETCAGSNNRFPTNDGNFRFDILYIIFMFFSIILTPVFFALIILLHILFFVIWLVREYVIWIFIGWAVYQAANAFVLSVTSYPALGLIVGFILLGLFYLGLAVFFRWLKKELDKIDLSGVKVPILTYPDCDLCSCDPKSETSAEGTDDGSGAAALAATNQAIPCPSVKSDTFVASIVVSPGILPLFNVGSYVLPTRGPNNPDGFFPERVQVYAQEFGGLMYDNQYASVNIGAPYLTITTNADTTANLNRYVYTTSLPLPDRINLFNVKAKYFNEDVNNPGGGVNRISVNFNPQRQETHTDNTIVIICDKTVVQSLISGSLVAFQNPTISKDINMTGGVENIYGNNAITGITTTGLTNVTVTYANPNGLLPNLSKLYQVNITATTTDNYHKFPTDIEYFQVITGMTYSQFSGQCNPSSNFDSLNNRYINNTTVLGQEYGVTVFGVPDVLIADNFVSRPMSYVRDHKEVCVLILNRGVDPYTTKVPIEYGLGKLFGYANESNKKVKGLYRMNIPIQGSYKNVSHLKANLNNSNVGTDSYSNQQLYFNSFSYKPQVQQITGSTTGYTQGQPVVNPNGVLVSKYSGFSSNLISYYSSMDSKSFNTFAPNCGGSINNTHGNIDNFVARVNISRGLNVSPTNRFSWSIFQRFFGPPYNFNINRLESSNTYSPNSGNNQGYFPYELIEGGPIMYTNLDLNNGSMGNSGTVYIGDVDNPPRYVFNTSDPNPANFAVTSTYYTPIYNTTGNTLNFTLGSNNNQIVMRSDRLPTSTSVEEYCCNAMVLQKNNKFQMYLVPDDGIIGVSSSQGSTGSASSGDLGYTLADVAGSSGITRVFDSFTCNGSVNLACYDCARVPGTSNGSIQILPHDCQESPFGKTIFEFGCYKFITTIFLSLPLDLLLMFEWIARNMVMLGACRNVFSHRFNNNWINGVLYAFPFKNSITFSSPTSATPNQPIINHCTETIQYYSKTKNFYYRATPYNTTTNKFTQIDSNINMGFPTTIMDLGPRADYIQELVMSDDYDGYVVNKLETSSYGTVDDILNLFIVSRFIDSTALKNLMGSLNILTYFFNKRSDNGVGGTSFQIDADYSQLISINSELGVSPFLSANYPDSPAGQQNPIFFDCDNVLGIFFSSDTQIRDYITPKRTIINSSGTSVGNCTFNNFPVYSQVVPLSQWEIRDTPYIFGIQSNNWVFEYNGGEIFSHKYQSLDRVNPNSRYFRTHNTNSTQYFKGYIYAVKNVNLPVPHIELSAASGDWDKNSVAPQLVTTGAPFHFYFGLKRGASAYDRFRTKWINTNNVVN